MRTKANGRVTAVSEVSREKTLGSTDAAMRVRRENGPYAIKVGKILGAF